MMTLIAFRYVTIIIKNALPMLSIIPNQGPMQNNKRLMRVNKHMVIASIVARIQINRKRINRNRKKAIEFECLCPDSCVPADSRSGGLGKKFIISSKQVFLPKLEKAGRAVISAPSCA